MPDKTCGDSSPTLAPLLALAAKADLAEVAAAWPDLADYEKATILTLIRGRRPWARNARSP
jgi:hypothetical protein